MPHIDDARGAHQETLGAGKYHVAAKRAVLIAVENAVDLRLAVLDDVHQLAGIVRHDQIHRIELANNKMLEHIDRHTTDPVGVLNGVQ